MKTIFSEYLKIVMYTIFGIIFVMSSYLIILNIRHYQSLTDTTIVSEIDNDYAKYKENVNLIEKAISSHNLDSKVSLILEKTLDVMKNDGVYRLIPKMKLNYKDLYNLNDYFMEKLINNSWISNLRELDISNKYNDVIMILVNNSSYLNNVFTGNSLILYDNKLDNKILDNYHFILSNYMEYSKVILNICNELGGESEQIN